MAKKTHRSWLSIIATILLLATLAPGAAAQSRQHRGALLSVPHPRGVSGSGMDARAVARCPVLAVVPPGARLDDQQPVMPKCEALDGAEYRAGGSTARGEAAADAAGEAYRRPGETERVSVASDGAEAGGSVQGPGVLSADGRYVAFVSRADTLVPGDTNGSNDVFVRDRETGTTERVSVASDGTEAQSESVGPSISGDGRYVAFYSGADNLVAGDRNQTYDVFVHNRETGTTERVSVASDGGESDGLSLGPSLSADGRFVAFGSDASNLVPDDDTNERRDAFVYDRETGLTERVSVAFDGGDTQNESSRPHISADGRYVAFWSFASNLVPGDTNGASDVFVRDRETGTTERVSVASDGSEANSFSESGLGAISADGRFIAFVSAASNLVPGDGYDAERELQGKDVFVHDRLTRTTERVSVASDGSDPPLAPEGAQDIEGSFSRYGGGGRAVAVSPAISADGRFVAFFQSPVLDNPLCSQPGDDPAFGSCPPFYRTVVHDRATGVTEVVSVASDGTEANGNSLNHVGHPVSISADGRHVAFTSFASNLVPGDGNDTFDVFVRDRGPATGVGRLTVAPGPDGFTASGWATFSGTTVAVAEDTPDDGVDDRGAEIIRTALIYRHEQHDLLMTIDLASLPRLRAGACDPFHDCVGHNVAGVPGMRYRWNLVAGGAAYEVRAQPVAVTATPPDAPHFALYECAATCTETARLSGGIGTTGAQVRVAVPLETMGIEEGATLTEVSSAALLEATAGLAEALDDVALPDAVIPAAHVELGIAPPSAPEAEVPFSLQAELVEGRYSGSLDASSLPPAAARAVWARACLGQNCRTRTVDMAMGVPDPDTSPSPSPTVGPTPIPTPTQLPGERGTYPPTPDDPYFGPGEDIRGLPIAQYGTQWGPQMIGAPTAWQENRATGHGIDVAVLDTGVDLGHPDLACPRKLKVVPHSDVVSNDSVPSDENGHGTHVAGIVGACTNNSEGIAGVAPDATIMPIRVLNAAGSGTDEQLIAGIERATEAGAEIINLSLSYGEISGSDLFDFATIDDAISDATAQGVVIIAAAGNSSFPLCEYPALAVEIICVGATDARDNKAWYSTFANKEARGGPALVAPGGAGTVFCDVDSEEILSLYARNIDTAEGDCDGRPGYTDLNGTSMAAPHVAGVAALVYDRLGGERSPENAQKVIDALTSTAVDLGPPGYDPVYGSGRVNALAAVCAAGPECAGEGGSGGGSASYTGRVFFI